MFPTAFYFKFGEFFVGIAKAFIVAEINPSDCSRKRNEAQVLYLELLIPYII